MEHHSLPFPSGRDLHLTSVIGVSNIFFVGSEKKREFYVPFLTVWLHIFAIVVRHIVERTSPSGGSIHIVSLAVGQHRTGKGDHIVIRLCVAITEIPRSGKIDCILIPCFGSKGCHNHQYQQLSSHGRNVCIVTSFISSPGVVSASFGK